MKISLWISRIVFGLVFIFSGFVKAIDPLGTAYKLQDYFLAFGTEWLFPIALPLSVFMNGMEFLIGVAVLLGLKMRYSAWGAILFMLFFTPLTLYIAIANPVPDCGCFGDAIIISNWNTFYKNLIFLIAAVLIFVNRDKIKPLWNKKADWLIILIIALSTFGLSFYCLRNLPIIDFRPWKIGNNVSELMEEKQHPVIAISFVYENIQTGKTVEISQDDIMNNGTPSANDWRYVSRNEIVLDPGTPAAIENFQILDEFGDEYTEYYIENSDFQFIVIAYDLSITNKNAFVNKINKLAQDLEENNYSLIVLSGNTFPIIDDFRHKYQMSYPIYQTDAIALKTIIRSNPGLIMLKDGVVLKKWAYRNIPEYEEIQSFMSKY
jgi:uncharacterized membrane protein YphA (DoxX/SURF4 family)